MKPKFIKVHFMGHSKNGVKHCDIKAKKSPLSMGNYGPKNALWLVISKLIYCKSAALMGPMHIYASKKLVFFL